MKRSGMVASHSEVNYLKKNLKPAARNSEKKVSDAIEANLSPGLIASNN